MSRAACHCFDECASSKHSTGTTHCHQLEAESNDHQETIGVDDSFPLWSVELGVFAEVYDTGRERQGDDA
jgi:hypothetical protein